MTDAFALEHFAGALRVCFKDPGWGVDVLL